MRDKVLIGNNKGISLLEVLVSLLILGFGMLGLAPMIVMSIEGNVISRDHSDVSRLAKEKIEYYEGLGTLPSMPYIELEDSVSNIYSRLTCLRDATVDSLIPAGVAQVDVQLSWVDNHSVNRTVTYSTYILK